MTAFERHPRAKQYVDFAKQLPKRIVGYRKVHVSGQNRTVRFMVDAILASRRDDLPNNITRQQRRFAARRGLKI